MGEVSSILNSAADELEDVNPVVLLVDDQAMIGEAVRRLLMRETDITFHYCASGTEARATAIRVQPTVILQDLVMPQIDGLQLLQEYQACPDTGKIPVIVLSTKEDPQTKKQAFELGASDYLVKLPDQIELIARIRHHSTAYIAQQQRDKAMDALSVALRDKSEFMRIASHDLKNPLTVILGSARLLEERVAKAQSGDEAEVNTQLVQVILRQADQMRKLVEDYLDAQAIEDGQLKLQLVTGDLNKVVSNVLADLQGYADSKDSVLHMELDDSLPAANFDAGRVAQVTINLCSNALKFSPKGSEVWVRTTAVTSLPNASETDSGTSEFASDPNAGTRYALLQVQDQGPGLLPEEMKQLFRRYGKLSARPTGNEKSTGLGLSICKRLVELHGGKIGALTNEGGEGSTFWFALPL